MVERNGPEGGPAGHGEDDAPAESGQQDDRSRVTGDRTDVPAEGAASEGTELIDDHQNADSESAGEVNLAGEQGSDGANDTGSGRSVQDAAASSDATEQTRISVDATNGADDAEVFAFRRPDDEIDPETDEIDPADLVDLDEVGDEPVDLARLQADDVLLDALGGTNPDSSTSKEQGPDLEALLVAWRQDVDSAPIGDLVDTDAAVTAISEGQRRPRRGLKRRHLVPVASAAAVLMITFTGVGLAARDALPGDMLWGVAQVLYTDHTRTVQAAASAQGDFRFAEQAWKNKDRTEALDAWQRGNQLMKSVDPEHGLADLRATSESLEKRFQRGHEETRTSTPETTSTSSHPPPVTSTSPPPSEPPVFPPPPSSPTETTPSAPPSSSQEPTAPTTSPSETSDSSERQSTAPSWRNSTGSTGTGGSLFSSSSR